MIYGTSPSSPVVKTLPSKSGDVDSLPGWGTKAPCAVECGQQENKTMLCAPFGLLYAVLVTTPQKRNNRIGESPNKGIYTSPREGGTSYRDRSKQKALQLKRDIPAVRGIIEYGLGVTCFTVSHECF